MVSFFFFSFFLACLLLICSFVLLGFENPIYSIFLLVLVFFMSSFLLIELNLFFLALMILIVYLGALIVLFLFVVMMLNIKALELNRFINFFPSVFIILFSCILLIFSTNLSSPVAREFLPYFLIFSHFNDQPFLYFHFTSFLSAGFLLYSFSLSFLIVVSLILLVAMLGAIVLTLSLSTVLIRQNSSDQLLEQLNLELFDLKF